MQLSVNKSLACLVSGITRVLWVLVVATFEVIAKLVSSKAVGYEVV